MERQRPDEGDGDERDEKIPARPEGNRHGENLRNRARDYWSTPANQNSAIPPQVCKPNPRRDCAHGQRKSSRRPSNADRAAYMRMDGVTEFHRMTFRLLQRRCRSGFDQIRSPCKIYLRSLPDRHGVVGQLCRHLSQRAAFHQIKGTRTGDREPSALAGDVPDAHCLTRDHRCTPSFSCHLASGDWTNIAIEIAGSARNMSRLVGPFNNANTIPLSLVTAPPQVSPSTRPACAQSF